MPSAAASSLEPAQSPQAPGAVANAISSSIVKSGEASDEVPVDVSTLATTRDPSPRYATTPRSPPDFRTVFVFEIGSVLEIGDVEHCSVFEMLPPIHQTLQARRHRLIPCTHLNRDIRSPPDASQGSLRRRRTAELDRVDPRQETKPPR